MRPLYLILFFGLSIGLAGCRCKTYYHSNEEDGDEDLFKVTAGVVKDYSSSDEYIAVHCVWCDSYNQDKCNLIKILHNSIKINIEASGVELKFIRKTGSTYEFISPIEGLFDEHEKISVTVNYAIVDSLRNEKLKTKTFELSRTKTCGFSVH